MKHLIWFPIFCFFFITPLALAGEIEKIQTKGELVVSLHEGSPPFSILLNNQLRGIDVDIATLLADYLGVSVRFVHPKTYDQQIPALLSGKADIIISAMTRTMDRGLKISFTNPYFEVSQAALVLRKLVKPAAESYFDLVDIEGLSMGIKTGSIYENYARELFPKTTIKLYPTNLAAVNGMIKGQVTAIIADSPFIKVWAKTHPEQYLKFKPLLTPVTLRHYAFAIRHGDPIFLNWLNLFIDQIKTDGTLDFLIYKYFKQSKKNQGIEKNKRAIFLKNKFIIQQQKILKKRRVESQKIKTLED
ncbi:MAG: transporter substrate-binding domain-containing protein [Desulfobacteraceae bacterium]|nr:transporter substrate-binding domain-containing protein [Desulfobacteraceae bacterium]